MAAVHTGAELSAYWELCIAANSSAHAVDIVLETLGANRITVIGTVDDEQDWLVCILTDELMTVDTMLQLFEPTERLMSYGIDMSYQHN